MSEVTIDPEKLTQGFPTGFNTFQGWPVWESDELGVPILIGMWGYKQTPESPEYPVMLMIVNGEVVDDRPLWIYTDDNDPRPSMTPAAIVDRICQDFNDQMPDRLGKHISQVAMELFASSVIVTEAGILERQDG